MRRRPRWRRATASRCCAMRRGGCWPITIRRRCPLPSAAGASLRAPRNLLLPVSTPSCRAAIIAAAPGISAHSGHVARPLVGRWRRSPRRWNEPGFVPYLGRKSCPLGLPLAPCIMEAADAPTALLARHSEGPEAKLEHPKGRHPTRRARRCAGRDDHRARRCRRGPERPSFAPHRVATGPAAVPSPLAVRPAGGGGARGRRRHERTVALACPAAGGCIGFGTGAATGARERQRPSGRGASSWFGHCSPTGRNRRRDFLWREEAPGRFMTLSRRPPINVGGLVRSGFPTLRAGAGGRVTGWASRCAPIPWWRGRTAPGQRGKRHDVVMDVLKPVAPDQRAEARPGRGADSRARMAGATRRGARLPAGRRSGGGRLRPRGHSAREGQAGDIRGARHHAAC